MLEWLETTSLAVTIRRSAWLYPILEIIHISGIVLLVGAAMMFDFRLLGFSKAIPVSTLANHVLPWSRRGLFLLVIPSGFLLFMANAATLARDTVFWLKMILLLFAVLNALFFHRFIFPSFRGKTGPRLDSLPAKAAATISLLLWIAIIACGRLLAY